MPKRNHWRTYDSALLEWKAQVPLIPDRPGDLLEWTMAVVDAAHRTQVALFRSETGAQRSILELRSYLEQRLRSEQVVDAFAFSANEPRTSSRLAYFDAAGVTEAIVDDLDALAARLHGAEARRPCDPFTVFGRLVDYRTDPKFLPARELAMTSVRFGLRSDIWLPWVPGLDESLARDTFFDNRELAERHTVRLNDFLADVRHATLSRGGTWQYINYQDRAWVDLMVGAAGVRLNSDSPSMQLVR